MGNSVDKEIRDMTNKYLSEQHPDAPKCITYDKEAQDNLPQHIKDKMQADRRESKTKNLTELLQIGEDLGLLDMVYSAEHTSHEIIIEQEKNY